MFISIHHWYGQVEEIWGYQLHFYSQTEENKLKYFSLIYFKVGGVEPLGVETKLFHLKKKKKIEENDAWWCRKILFCRKIDRKPYLKILKANEKRKWWKFLLYNVEK